MKSKNLVKVDFAKTHKDLYTATAKVKEVTADKATFLSCKGTGEPGGAEFEAAIQALYSMAYTTKFRLKFSGKLDFAVSRLECLWHTEDMSTTPKSEWIWQLLIRIPGAVTATDLKRSRQELIEKGKAPACDVERWTWREGRCLQVMHIGPYDEIGRSYKLLDDYAQAKGLTASCPAHEMYISDPRRVPPAKLKTIARLSIGPAKGRA